MKLSLCTISFRHHLQSMDQIAHFAQTNGFQGIELWGAHAKNLAEDIHYGSEWLSSYGLEASMLSDYLPLDAPLPVLIEEMNVLCALAHRWGTDKIRTFAGNKGSADISRLERIELVSRMKMLCKMAEAEGMQLLVETHPNTLTDNPSSTLQLIEETDHPALRVNFDVLHIWESGVDPLYALKQLRPYVSHFHLKNIESRTQLDVFAPTNVYAAAGIREGMVSLFEGTVDYRLFLKEAAEMMEIEASLEWFGGNVKDVLARDSREVRRVVGADALTSFTAST
ncbi:MULTISPECIES: sugar phosphate isomerase/epimerase [unclassified Sutcliffiella]|uniref:sugar phosphate isomerase/epimerase family protein n=1 Tax=unclassified Sutcliffiella TaxID=2837532 RepID=UPI0030CBF84F